MIAIFHEEPEGLREIALNIDTEVSWVSQQTKETL